jgi:hypothetical protein
MPNDINSRMEDMSFAYVKALCAQKGYTLNKAERDNDGIDATIECKGLPAEDCTMMSCKMDVQLKATHSNSRFYTLNNGDYRFVLESKNYNHLVQNKRMIQLILIVFHMDPNQSNWLDHSKNSLKITKCAYWLSLIGKAPINNTSSITVTIPKENILSPDELERLIIKVAKEETL